MEKPLTLENSLVWIKMLSTLEKIQLIQQLTKEIELELSATSTTSRKSLRGLWKGLHLYSAPSQTEIFRSVEISGSVRNPFQF